MQTEQKKRILVTGGSGKVGKTCVEYLINKGYEVFIVDLVSPENKDILFMQADLTNFGETLDAMSSVGEDVYGHAETKAFDAVVHLASIPHPRMVSDADTFHNNMQITFNVFESAKRLGIKNIVWSSSETLLGIPLEQKNLPYLPLGDEYSDLQGTTSYALTKVLGEELARQFCKNNPEFKITCLRLSNVMDIEDYKDFPQYQNDPEKRIWNLWSYIDVRDAAQAIQKAIELPTKGFDTFIITNADTVMHTPTAELVKKCFPNVPLKKELQENETLLSIQKAKDILGYHPKHSWRNEL